eukprot:m.76525 g.76525  ORF g.76525 m.76525 type:complete len:72 (-) comp12563_c0_seq2:1045-1260(-)
MYLLLLTTSTLSAMTTGSPGAPCQTDIQCSLNGECVDGICICDEGLFFTSQSAILRFFFWGGVVCARLRSP